MAKKGREFNPFSLSFLDIMSCGLGAVILIFLILKHGESSSPEQTKMLIQDIRSAEIDKEFLQKEINKRTEQSDILNSSIETKEAELKKLKRDLSDEQKLRNNLLKNNNQAREEIDKMEESIPDIVQRANQGERQYLTGLKVEGKHILFLLDNSASMLDENVQKIFATSILDNQSKQTQKWIRAKDSLTWLTSRLPKESKFSIMTFNDQVESHTQSQWLDAKDPIKVNSTLASALKVIPERGTNLEKVLLSAKKMFPLPDLVVIITDGLPTIGEPYVEFKDGILAREERNCLNSLGKISSRCRHVLFQKAKKNYLDGRKIQTSTILLPLQGDPHAAIDYWNLGQQSGGGISISPARDWP